MVWDNMKKITVTTATTVYPIVISAGLLKNVDLFKEFVAKKKVVIITNAKINHLYGSLLRDTLNSSGTTSLSLIEIQDGEKYKNSETLSAVYEKLFEYRSDRKTVLLALGGGIVGDVTGFAAATYMRGIPYIQVPTTLLAQIDSSIGGKTGINHSAGKNMIGAFKHPIAVFSDVNVLNTLPKRELFAGLAEVIKSALIADQSFFAWLEENVDLISDLYPDCISELIYRTCRIKQNIVEQDEFEETGLRGLLNFGHNIGHAIESLSHYECFLHGEAVALGMCMEAYLSNKLGLLETNDLLRIECLIKKFHLLHKIPNWSVDDYIKLLLMDKKNVDGKLCFTILNGIGKANLTLLDIEQIKDFILEYFNVYQKT